LSSQLIEQFDKIIGDVIYLECYHPIYLAEAHPFSRTLYIGDPESLLQVA